MQASPVVLGVTMSHDAGVCLIKDGRVVAAINEERLARKKQIAGCPSLSLESIWKVAGVSPKEVGIVALANKFQGPPPPINSDLSDLEGASKRRCQIAEMLDRVPGVPAFMRSDWSFKLLGALQLPLVSAEQNKLQAKLRELGVVAPLYCYDHHDCHIAAAYYTSGWDDCLILSNDGFGDSLCAKVGVAKNGRLTTCHPNSFYNSIGMYYLYVTNVCGFKKAYHAGKVTGLAAHGDPERTIGFFRKYIPWDEAQGKYVSYGPALTRLLRLMHREFKDVDIKHVAAGMQRHLEETFAKMALHYKRKYGLNRVALTGGVHANVRANQTIAELGWDGVYVFPHMGDGGLSVGASYLALAEQSPEPIRSRPLKDVYLGPVYAENQLVDALKGQPLPYSKPADPEEVVAKAISEGKIVARFDGRMEFGPRALGNRTIMYQTTDARVNTWLNKQLRRTEFMPFAPVLRACDAPAFMRGYGAATEYTSQFMTITYPVTERCKKEAPAVVHLDGTARPQVLQPGVNDGYYRVLEHYHRMTGLSVLVNTSFNLHEEPIICTPEEALRSFVESNLHVMLFGPFVVTNPAVERVKPAEEMADVGSDRA